MGDPEEAVLFIRECLNQDSKLEVGKTMLLDSCIAKFELYSFVISCNCLVPIVADGSAIQSCILGLFAKMHLIIILYVLRCYGK